MVFQHTVRPQDLPEFLGGLLDDGGVGDHIDEAAKPLGFCLGQSKGERGHSFTATGGDGQRVETGRTALPLLDTPL